MTWSIAYAAICDTSSSSVPLLCDPTHSGSIDSFIANVLTGVGTIIGILIIGMVVYSGFRMIISQGNEEEVAKAKTSLQWSLSGFIVIVMAFAIVSAIGLFFQHRDNTPNTGDIQNPIVSSDVFGLADTIFAGALSIVGLVAITLIIINGIRYLTARGNEEKVQQATRGLQWAVIGLIITILAYVIVTATAKLLFP